MNNVGHRGRVAGRAAWSTWALAVILAALPAAARADSRDLDVQLQPTFSEMKGALTGLQPVTVTLWNRGKDATGVLEVSGGYTMTYPIELPGGSVKRIQTYVSSSPFQEQSRFVLDTDQGLVSRTWRDELANYDRRKPLLLVSDSEGAMSFMRVRSPSASSAEEEALFPRDVYAKPGELPDRAIGYSCLRAVILGEGSERLKDAEVHAIQTWVIAGGTLVMIGGASSPLLTDPRWSAFAPVSGASPSTIPTPSGLEALGKESPPAGMVAVMRGVPGSGCSVRAEHGVPYLVARPVGMGKVVFLAFNPFEPPMDKWGGRAKLFTNLTDSSFGITAFDWLQASDSESGSSRGYAGPGVVSRYGGPYGTGEPNDPFSVKLPPVATVVWILLGYLVLVVPVNLVALRKLNRSAWAWGTTPALSLAFAAIFFRFASGLYSAELSVADTGILILDSRFDTGYYAGQTQLFFPRGGSYDLRLHAVEAVIPTLEYDYGYGPGGGSGSTAALHPTDVGQIVVDHLSATNLSFHQFSFCESVTTAKWLDARIKLRAKRHGAGAATMVASGTLTNRSPYKISGLLSLGAWSATLPELAPGATVALKNLVLTVGQVTPQTYMPPGSGGPDRPQTTVTSGPPDRLVIQGRIEGFRPGSQIGAESPVNRDVRIFAVLGDVPVPEVPKAP